MANITVSTEVHSLLNSGGVLANSKAALATLGGVSAIADTANLVDVKGKTATLARFDLLTAGDFVGRGDLPEIGGAWAITQGTVTEQRLTALEGGGIVGSGNYPTDANNLFYLGNDPGEPIRSIVFELEYRPVVGSVSALPNGFTFAFNDQPVLNPNSPYNFTFPIGTIHFETSVAGIATVSYNTVAGTVGGNILLPYDSPTNTVTPILWNNDAGAIPIDKKFIIEFQFEGNEMRVIAFGKTWVYRDAILASHPARYWFIENQAPNNTTVTYFGVIHQIHINSDKWKSQRTSDVIGDLLGGAPLQRNILQGGSTTSSSLNIRSTSAGSPTVASQTTIFGGINQRSFTAGHNGFMSVGAISPITTVANWPTIQLLGTAQQQGTVLVGNSTTQATNKDSSLNFAHYNGQTSGVVAGIRVASTSSNTTTSYGGSNISIPATMQHSFYTGATNTTYSGGTERLRIGNAGAITTETVGQTLGVKSGTNALSGTFTANGATPVAVATTAWDANCVAVITLKTIGGTVTSQPFVSSVTAGTGFSVTSAVGDTSTYNWVALKVN